MNADAKRGAVAKAVVTILILVVGGLGARYFLGTKEEAPTQIPERLAPLVRTTIVQRAPYLVTVRSEGTVRPRTQSTLVPEVAGRIVRVAPSWADGAFFEKDDVLLEIDAVDYELALAEARSRVAQAELARDREEEEAAAALADWQELNGKDSSPPDLVVRKPQLAETKARLEAARAGLKQAEINLERTKIKGAVRRPHSAQVGRLRTVCDARCGGRDNLRDR